MNELNKIEIPLSVIAKGRELGGVLSAYMDAFKDAGELVDTLFDDEAERFAEKTKFAVYRIYLLGVEDGMKP